MSEETQVHRFLYLCRVCGFDNKNPPWGAKGQNPSHAICPCCGTEFGYDDATPAGIKSSRERWFNEGCEWFIDDLKPARWNAATQMKALEGSPWDLKDQETMS